MRKVRTLTIILFLFFLALGSIAFSFVQAQTTSVTVTIDKNTVVAVSDFKTAWTITDRSLDASSPRNLTAVANVKNLIKEGISYTNTHIMAWGAGNPWPDPQQTEPTNWGQLDKQLDNILETGSTPVITLMNVPWWMKGTLQANGTTLLIPAQQNPSDPSVSLEWENVAAKRVITTNYTDYRDLNYIAGYTSPDPYNGRVLDNQMNNWLKLVQRVAERYMVAPYNVRHFQVWNEMKGYYNPATNRTDISTSAGDPTGYNAKHGYTYMYNQVYARLRQTATNLGIDPNTIKIGGPYNIIDSEQSSLSHPSNLRGPWGIIDQRDLDDMKYWLENKTGAQFITIDERNHHRSGSAVVDGFTMNDKLAAYRAWLRDPTGGNTTLPIWVAELYLVPDSRTTPSIPDTDATRNAVAADALIKMIPTTSVPLFWGGTYEQHSRPPLWTPTEMIGGGQSTPFYGTFKTFGKEFPPGAQIYKVTLSDATKLNAMVGPTKTVLVNKTNASLPVNIGTDSYTLAAYEVKWVTTPGSTATPTPTRTPTPTSNPTPTPVPQTVVSFTLINADTDQDIMQLTNGATIDYAAIGTKRINIRANTMPSPVGSVRFGLDGNSNYRVENSLPYAIAGDMNGTDYNAWTPAAGSHTITATPYTGTQADGTAGTPLTITFTVSNVPGDTDNDGDIDIFDYNAVLGNLGATSGATRAGGDLDGDGDVDIFDYNLVIGNFGT